MSPLGNSRIFIRNSLITAHYKWVGPGNVKPDVNNEDLDLFLLPFDFYTFLLASKETLMLRKYCQDTPTQFPEILDLAPQSNWKIRKRLRMYPEDLRPRSSLEQAVTNITENIS